MSDEPPPDGPEAAPAEVRSDSAFETMLTQAEIDAATGFVPPPEPARPAGLRGILDGPAAARGALPMLDIVVDRFVAAAGAALAAALGPGADLSRRSVRPERYGAYLDGLDQPAQAFVLRADGWNGPAAAFVGPGLVYLVLDRLLGAVGPGAAPPGAPPPRDRAPTALERSVLSRIVALVLRAADESFGTLAPVTFRVERTETDPAAAEIAGPGDAVLPIALALELDGRVGQIDLVLPFATLSPVRDALGETFLGEEGAASDPWGGHFATELWGAPVAAEAVLHETQMPLGRILQFGVGDTLMFDRKPTDLVTVRCGGVTLTRGRIGRVDGRIAVQVVEPLHPSQARGARPGPA